MKGKTNKLSNISTEELSLERDLLLNILEEEQSIEIANRALRIIYELRERNDNSN